MLKMDAFILHSALEVAKGTLKETLTLEERKRAKELRQALANGKAMAEYLAERKAPALKLDITPSSETTEKGTSEKTEKPAKKSGGPGRPKGSKTTCAACEKTGHNARTCPNKRHCTNCGIAGHYKATCPKLKKAKKAA